MDELRRLAAACLILLAGCASPVDRKPQMANLQGAVAQAFDGDVGALIFHGYEAARQAEVADVARAELAAQPSYLAADTRLTDQAMQLADQAAEHRRQAEAALNRILDPLRQRIADLEASSRPATAGPALTVELEFPGGSAALPAPAAVKLAAAAAYLARHPGSRVTITGFAAASGRALSLRRAEAVYAALDAQGLPRDVTVAIVAAPANAAGPVPEGDGQVTVEFSKQG
jgi:outer membrane protein OmpA-like peptidoglycan-associated protein